MLNLDAKEVDKKESAGKTSDGRPVIYIYTKGGLHAFFTRKAKTSQIEPIGIGSHRAVAQWMAEKKESIKWEDTFNKKENEDFTNLTKSESNQKRLNAALNYHKTFENSEKSDKMIVKHWTSKEVVIMSEKDVKLAVTHGIIGADMIVRDLNLCTLPMTASKYIKGEE